MKKMKKTTKLNLHTIKSLAFLDELIMWHGDGNFDRVSGFGILMIFLNEIESKLDSYLKQESNDIYNDPFYVSFFKRKSYNRQMDLLNRMGNK